MYLTLIVDRAMADAAFDVAISIPHCGAALFGTEHLVGLIGGALPLSAHHISVLIPDAIRGFNVTKGAKLMKKPTRNLIFTRSSSD